MLTPEKRALVNFIVVAGARGPIRGGSKPDALFPPRIVKIADLYVAFIAAPLVTSVKSNLFRRSLSTLPLLSLFLFLRSDEFFEKLRARTTDNRRRSLREGRLRPLKHMASKRAEEKDFYPTGGPRGFSTARRAASSASSVRLPGPGTMENVYHGSRLEQYT